MKTLELVVFDMAGTTVDEDNLVYKTILHAFRRAGIEASLGQVLQVAAGKEKSQAIRDLLAECNGQEAAARLAHVIFHDFRQLLGQAYQDAPVFPMPGAELVFRKLRQAGIRVVLNTGYDRSTADALLAKLGWDRLDAIDFTVTASEVARSRPWPDMIRLAMEKCGIDDPGAVAKVGDSAVDIEEGRNAGCGLVFGITSGAQNAEQLEAARPHFVVDSLEEMLRRIEAHNAGHDAHA